MTPNPPRSHLWAGLLAGLVVLGLATFAINYGRITPEKTLQTALVNTLALDSVSVEAAGSWQLANNESLQIGSLALSSTLTNLQTGAANWASQLSLVATDLRTPATPTSESRDLELQVIDGIAYFRLQASESLPADFATSAIEIDEWYRLTTEPAALGLALSAEQTATLRELIVNPKLWSTIADTGFSTEGQRQLTATIDWQMLATTLPELAFLSQVFTVQTLQVEFWIAADEVGIEQFTVKVVLTQPTSDDTITLDLAVLLREQNQVPPLVAPIAIDTRTELPALNLLD